MLRIYDSCFSTKPSWFTLFCGMQKKSIQRYAFPIWSNCASVSVAPFHCATILLSIFSFRAISLRKMSWSRRSCTPCGSGWWWLSHWCDTKIVKVLGLQRSSRPSACKTSCGLNIPRMSRKCHTFTTHIEACSECSEITTFEGLEYEPMAVDASLWQLVLACTVL